MFFINYTSIKLEEKQLFCQTALKMWYFLFLPSLPFIDFEFSENILCFNVSEAFHLLFYSPGILPHGHGHIPLVSLVNSSFKTECVLPSLNPPPEIPIFIQWGAKNISPTVFITYYHFVWFGFLICCTY